MQIQEFVKLEKRKILLANKVSVGNTLLRSLNLHENIVVCDVKVHRISEIAKELIEAYDAYKDEATRDVLDGAAASYFLEDVMRQGNYVFFPDNVITQGTLRDLYKCMCELRMNDTTEEWDNVTDAKAIEIKRIIEAFENKLQEANVLDEALLLQEALRIVEKEQGLIPLLIPKVAGAMIGDLETNQWSDLEKALIKKLAGEKYTLVNFLNEEKTNAGAVSYAYYKAYGMVNEISYIVNNIKNPCETAVYYSNASYINYIKSAFDNAGISYKIVGGNPATETDFVQFMLGVLKCAGDDFLYSELKSVIQNNITTFYNVGIDNITINPIRGYNSALSSGIGWGYERYKAYVDTVLEETDNLEKDSSIDEAQKERLIGKRIYAKFLRDFIDIFVDNDENERAIEDIFTRLVDFTRKYTYRMNPDYIKLKGNLDDLKKTFKYIDEKDLSLSDKTECLSNMISGLNFDDEDDGATVLVAPINGFVVLDRPDVYVIGLNATSFTLDMKQSPILYDEEKCLYMEHADLNALDSNVDLAINRNLKRKDQLLQSFRTMYEGHISLIYSYYDTISLRECSASVFFMEITDGETIESTSGYVEKNYLQNNMGDASKNIRIDEKELFDVAKKERDLRDGEKKKEKEKKQLIQNEPKQSKNRKKKIEVTAEKLDEEENAENVLTEQMQAQILSEDQMEDERIKITQTEADEKEEKNDKNGIAMSASGMQVLLKCPWAYYYMYENYLRVYDEYEKSGYEWLNASAKGNLCHHVMERYMAECMPTIVKAEDGTLSVPTGLSGEMNEKRFEEIYQEEVEKIAAVVPSSSDAIKEREIEHYKELISNYIIKQHRLWEEDAKAGRNYTIIGCELAFDQVDYEDVTEELPYTLKLVGSIDRMDGYVDENGILQIRIVDYKTGKKKSKMEEVEDGTQVQHFIYGIAALAYLRSFLKEQNNQFLGTPIKDINFEQIAYVFPYVEDDGSEDYDVYDVTELVTELLHTESTILESKIELPGSVRSVLHDILGSIPNSQDEVRACARGKLVEKRIDQQIKRLQKENFEAQRAKQEELHQKKLAINPTIGAFHFTEADVEVSYTLEDFCKDNYCVYKNICRNWMGDK